MYKNIRKLQIDESIRCSSMDFLVFQWILTGSEKVARQHEEATLHGEMNASKAKRAPLRRNRWQRKNPEQDAAAETTKAGNEEAAAQKIKGKDGEIPKQSNEKGGEAAANQKAGMTDEGSG